MAEEVDLSGDSNAGDSSLRSNLILGANLLAEAFGHRLEAVTESTSTVVAATRRSSGQRTFAPGDTIGFHHRVEGRAGSIRIASEWVGLIALSLALDGMEEGTSIEIDGPKPMRAEIAGAGMSAAYRTAPRIRSSRYRPLRRDKAVQEQEDRWPA